jgi:hypothetical protein
MRVRVRVCVGGSRAAPSSIIRVVHLRWLKKNTVVIDGSHLTSSPLCRMTWWGSSLVSLTNALTGTSHMGYFISTAVPTILRRKDASPAEGCRSDAPTLDEEAPMVNC